MGDILKFYRSKESEKITFRSTEWCALAWFFRFFSKIFFGKISKEPPLHNLKTECPLNWIETSTEWCSACTRYLFFFLRIFSTFSFEKISKDPPFGDQLTDCFHMETTFFQVPLSFYSRRMLYHSSNAVALLIWILLEHLVYGQKSSTLLYTESV